jgi:membrane-associated phospholipid phosphatase
MNMSNGYLLTLLVLALFHPVLIAQRTKSPSFPYTLTYQEEGIIGGGSALILAVGYAVPRTKPVYTPQDFDNLTSGSVNGFDRGATGYYSVSDDHLRTYMLAATGVAGAVSLPLLSYVHNGHRADKPFWTQCTILATMYAEGLAFNLGVNEWSKKFVDRARPYAYNPTLSYADKSAHDYLSSFYSNTTALQWYTAAFIAKVINDWCPDSPYKYYIWGGAAAYSIIQGYLGVRSGQHFPTDVIAGAFLGGITGFLVPQLHKKQANHRSFSIIPGVTFAGTPQLCFVSHF